LKFKYFLYTFLFIQFIGNVSIAQERKKIRVSAPYYDKNEETHPGAVILTRNSAKQIYIEHEGIEMWCDKAYHYAKEDSIAAFGNVKIKQGDTIQLTSKVANYSGATKLAFTAGDVFLREPKSTLRTDTLYFDRIKQQAFYKTGGVIHHEKNIIKSNIGRYFMDNQKYQFVSAVDIKNPEYTLNSSQLDFYSDSGLAYMYGKSVIKHTNTTIHCERGFYDTNADLGYFVKNSKIYYSNRIFEGDSMYFNQKRNFASATNNIKVTDTVNHSIITGHYAEVFKEKDSVFITKRALAKTLQEKDSIYIHADTLMITGKQDNRIIRGFHKAKLFKSDMNGKCDSIHINQATGITRLIRKPVLWSGNNQIVGDSINLYNTRETNKLDSLRVFYNTFIIEKDTIQGYNQLKGKELTGYFNDENKLHKIIIDKNAEQLNYVRDDKKPANESLIGINKNKSSTIHILLENNTIEEVTYFGAPGGSISPDSMFPENARKLRGFEWRGDERILSIEDLFSEDPPLELVKIRGLEERELNSEDLDEIDSKEEKAPIKVDKKFLKKPKLSEMQLEEKKKEKENPNKEKTKLLIKKE